MPPGKLAPLSGSMARSFCDYYDQKRQKARREATRLAHNAFVLAINVGGEEFTSPSGMIYLEDQYFTDGSVLLNTEVLDDHPEASVFQSSRFGDFVYSIPVDDGSYSVTFKFAEISEDPVVEEDRVFTVTVNTSDPFTIDIVEAAGGQYLPYNVTIPVMVSDGSIDISVDASSGVPTLNGIVVHTR